MTSGADAVGTVRVPGFVLADELGRGATARVFLARRAPDQTPTAPGEGTAGTPPTDRTVAIKMAIAGDATEATLEHEARVLERLADIDPTEASEADGQHRWARLVARVTAVDEHGALVPALVLEHVEGTSMRDLLAAAEPGEPASPPDCELDDATWWPDLTATLTALHGAGIVHGDLAPGNVMVTPRGTPVLVDFDAATVPGVKPPATIRGTPPFRPPGADQRPARAEDDLYALDQLLRAWEQRRDDPVGDCCAEKGASRSPGIDAMQTREFGPRPPRPAPRDTDASRRGRGPIVAALTAAAIGLVCLVTGGYVMRPPTSTESTVTELSAPSASSPASTAPSSASCSPSATASSMPTDGAADPAANPPSVPTTTAAAVDAPAGGMRLRADLDGAGCAATIDWRSDQAEAVVTRSDGTIMRFQLGDAGDQLVVGDWDGDHRRTPALYRPSSGVVFEFTSWASPGDPQPVATARRTGTLGGTPTVIRAGDHDEIHIEPAARATAPGHTSTPGFR